MARPPVVAGRAGGPAIAPDVASDAAAARPAEGAGGRAPDIRPYRAKRGEGEQLREEILDATQALLDEMGDEDKISIRKVAERVGRTSPSIYLHFADKDELMFAVCQRQYAASEEAMVAAAEGVAHPLERMRALGLAFVHWGLANPEQFRILFLTDRSEEFLGVRLEQVQQVGAFLAASEMLADAQEAGLVAATEEPLAVVLDLWAALLGITTLLVTRPDFGLPDPDAWVDHLMATVLDGLRPR